MCLCLCGHCIEVNINVRLHPFSFIEQFSQQLAVTFLWKVFCYFFFYGFEHKWSSMSTKAYAADTLWQSIDHPIVMLEFFLSFFFFFALWDYIHFSHLIVHLKWSTIKKIWHRRQHGIPAVNAKRKRSRQKKKPKTKNKRGQTKETCKH